MIKPITKDILFLQQKSQEASPADLSIGQDLQDTLLAHQDACVGLGDQYDWGSKADYHCQPGLWSLGPV